MYALSIVSKLDASTWQIINILLPLNESKTEGQPCNSLSLAFPTTHNFYFPKQGLVTLVEQSRMKLAFSMSRITQLFCLYQKN